MKRSRNRLKQSIYIIAASTGAAGTGRVIGSETEIELGQRLECMMLVILEIELGRGWGKEWGIKVV